MGNTFWPHLPPNTHTDLFLLFPFLFFEGVLEFHVISFQGENSLWLGIPLKARYTTCVPKDAGFYPRGAVHLWIGHAVCAYIHTRHSLWKWRQCMDNMPWWFLDGTCSLRSAERWHSWLGAVYTSVFSQSHLWAVLRNYTEQKVLVNLQATLFVKSLIVGPLWPSWAAERPVTRGKKEIQGNTIK